MNSKKVKLTLVAFVHVCLLLTCSAYVQATPSDGSEDTATDVDMSHWYLGGRAGWANFQDACNDNNTDCANDTLGYGVYGGYQLTPWFALETGVTDYGSPDASYGRNHIEADVLGAQVTGVFSYGLSTNLDAYARVGASYQIIEKQRSWADEQTSNQWGIISAIGLDYALSDNWSVRGEYQFIDGIGDDEVMQADLHFVSLGLTYRFGQTKQPVMVAAPLVPAVIPVPSVTTKVVLNGQALFGFDSDVVQSSEELTALVQKAVDVNNGALMITGHTDNLGQAEYNQKLSEKRAQAVASYLNANGVDTARTSIIGLGETMPIAPNTDPVGRAKNRRVEVEFTGSETEVQMQPSNTKEIK